LLGTSTSVVWLLLSVVLDLTFFLVQLLLGLFKLAIALYLLWLIVDLLLMRPLAWAESTLPRSRR
jgi:threonine/homoserine/homoserine lactone efflux protein